MPSFDIVSRTELPEVDNALQSARREIETRYDFKGSNCSIERSDETLTINADDDFKLKQVQELLRGHMAKRKVDTRAFDFQKPEKASGNSLRQTVAIKQGVDRELAAKDREGHQVGKTQGPSRHPGRRTPRLRQKTRRSPKRDRLRQSPKIRPPPPIPKLPLLGGSAAGLDLPDTGPAGLVFFGG